MPVSAPNRVSGGAPAGSRVLPRTARPLNGQEIAEAIKSHLRDLSHYILGKHGMETAAREEFVDGLMLEVDERVSRQTMLNKVHIRFPKVGWNLKVRLEDDEIEKTLYLSAECELDLERNIRLVLQFGDSGKGTIIDTVEDERLSTTAPDTIREQFALPIEVQVVKPDGQVGTMDLNDVAPKRAARRVDVGTAAIAKPETGVLIEVITPEVSAQTLESAMEVTVASQWSPETTIDLDPPVVTVATSESPIPPVIKPNARLKSYTKGRVK